MEVFKRSHPVVLCSYFLVLLIALIVYQHPMCIIFICLSCLFVCYKILPNFYKLLKVYIILFLILFLTNPLFVREGADWLYQGRYILITKQALGYGAVFGITIIGVLAVFQIFQECITSEHIVFLFSKRLPVLGLLIMLVFRLLPKCTKRVKEIQQIQSSMGMGVTKGSLIQRLRSLKDQFLMLFTWAFESSLMMYESMKARGYQSKRSHFHLFRWKKQDYQISIFIIIMGIVFIFGYRLFKNYYYYPIAAPITFGVKEWLIYGICVVYPLVPLWLERRKI